MFYYYFFNYQRSVLSFQHPHKIRSWKIYTQNNNNNNGQRLSKTKIVFQNENSSTNIRLQTRSNQTKVSEQILDGSPPLKKKIALSLISELAAHKRAKNMIALLAYLKKKTREKVSMRQFSQAIYVPTPPSKERDYSLHARPKQLDDDAASERRVKVAVVSPSASLHKARHAPTCSVCESVWPSGKALGW